MKLLMAMAHHAQADDVALTRSATSAAQRLYPRAPRLIAPQPENPGQAKPLLPAENDGRKRRCSVILSRRLALMAIRSDRLRHGIARP